MKVGQGNTIIEVLIAATIISIAVLAAIGLSNRTQKATDYSRDLNQATTFNIEAIDWLRNMRHTMGWATLIDTLQNDAGINTSVSYCLATLPADATSFASIASTTTCTTVIGSTPFTRRMNITWNGTPPTSINIVTITAWDGGSRTATSETELYQW